MKIKLFLLVILSVISLSRTSAQPKIFNQNELAGTYAAGHKFGGSAITLQSDGTYKNESGNCTHESNESGTYVFESGVLHFTILKYTAHQHGSENETIDLLDPQQRKELFGADSGEIKKTFKLIPVKWSERIYLIPEEKLADFCNAVNLGIEPRRDLSSEYYFGSFYLREGDETKPVTGMPFMPGERNSLLLAKPVTATVIKVEGERYKQIAVIDKGSLDGLKAGIRLIGETEEPSAWAGVKVLSVEKKTATVEVSGEVKVGYKLSTKFVPSIFNR